MEGKIVHIFVIMLLTLPILTVAANVPQEPTKPEINGPCEAEIGTMCTYNIISTDPQGDKIYYEVRCSDDPGCLIKLGPYSSGTNLAFEHCWCTFYQKNNPFFIRCRSIDENGHESDWAKFETNVSGIVIKDNNVLSNMAFFRFINTLHERFSLFFNHQIFKLIIQQTR